MGGEWVLCRQKKKSLGFKWHWSEGRISSCTPLSLSLSGLNLVAMDVYPNVAVPGGKAAAGCQPEKVPSQTEFLPGEIEGGDDVSLEWLSMFMEDCLSATPSYTLAPQPNPTPITTINNNNNSSVQASAIPSNSRPKRRKITQNAHYHLQAFHGIPSDPPLLHQTLWLADSELIFPKKNQESKEAPPPALAGGGGPGEEEVEVVDKEVSQQPRRCTHCLSQKTPQWRTGPQGPKTLCNACGVRFKSGRLLPEYRPAKSPTFVSYNHSNSHKKIMEMRMALLSSPSK